ncbi:unnamed protein product [Urochloa humidicola]
MLSRPVWHGPSTGGRGPGRAVPAERSGRGRVGRPRRDGRACPASSSPMVHGVAVAATSSSASRLHTLVLLEAFNVTTEELSQSKISKRGLFTVVPSWSTSLWA